MELLDFETNFESATKTFLGTDLSSFSSLQYVSSLDQTEFTVPRIEINAELQGAEDPPTFNSENNIVYSKYSLNYALRIVTDASDDRNIGSSGLSSAEFHRRIRREVRKSMLLNSTNFTSTNLEYYTVRYMRPLATEYEVDGDLFISTLNYEIKFTIKPDAWD